MMPNEKFKRAIFEALTPEYENAVPQEQDHIFSSAFEKKMSRLIKRRNKPYFMMINTAGKRAACFIIGIVVASSLAIVNVEALRNAFVDFFMNIFEKFAIVQSIDNDESPQTIENIYEITYDLAATPMIYGFVMIFADWLNIQMVKYILILDSIPKMNMICT